ncbi:flagellar biosynthesis protein FlhA [Myxococcota bacterium]|nr:flagellar biosynthesis protein FlhA [Myxococcota bacterium]MBU1379841.1 flagellar biosynthesis protein FlhA [Myxococcota bacterium]MBU1496490.1 flagellar biosynthesis protein FlhA [Myxococcota bacterium]
MKKYGNIVIASIVVAILILLIIPLPTFALDMLLTLNIAIAASLLLVSLYVSEPLRIAAFPSILLIATMFRLGLNVSSTRLILLNADAGKVIESFGQFVVSGNIIVGAVIFLILTIIQFLVVAKGSERVAEVAARFTLDAMPGVQMSIDAELRSGNITYEQARKKRHDLQRQSQMYGAMDGAMKFVKGDAIAGLIITTINIIAGLAVGMTQMGMSGSEALSTYSVLTVGDGLVSQIPSLLTSLSAGFIITRVASEEKGTELGNDIISQLTAYPAALMYTGGLLFFMALIPGLPLVPFMIAGILIGITGHRLSKRSAKATVDDEQPIIRTGDTSEPSDEGIIPPIRPIVLEIPSSENMDSEMVRMLLSDVRSAIFWKYGMLISAVKLVKNPSLPENRYVIMIREKPVASGTLLEGFQYYTGPLPNENVEDFEAVSFRGLSSPVWNVPAQRPENSMLVQEKLYDPEEFMVFHLQEVIENNLHELMNPDNARILVASLEKTQSALVEECFPSPVNLTIITDVLKRLLEEKVSIRQLDRILYTLKKWVAREGDPVVLTEYVRMELKNDLSFSSSGITGVYIAASDTEEEVRAGIQKSPTGSFLSMDPDAASDLQERAIKIRESMPDKSVPLIVVASMDVRRYLRQLLFMVIPDIVVLSYQELDPTITIQPFGEL